MLSSAYKQFHTIVKVHTVTNFKLITLQVEKTFNWSIKARNLVLPQTKEIKRDTVYSSYKSFASIRNRKYGYMNQRLIFVE